MIPSPSLPSIRREKLQKQGRAGKHAAPSSDRKAGWAAGKLGASSSDRKAGGSIGKLGASSSRRRSAAWERSASMSTDAASEYQVSWLQGCIQAAFIP